MQTLKATPGVKNLRAMVEMSSSARLLNLHGLAEERPSDPDRLAAPMFAHPVLNRAIIAKHNVAAGEEERLAPRRFNATKVIFPLDPRDLNLGGQYLFIEQHDFVGVLGRHLEYGDRPLERDLAVLRLMDRLPTLDPFLLREALAREEIEVDRSYFRFSQPDKAHMLGFVEGQMGSLIKLCFGDLRPEDRRTKRLSRLLLADSDSPDLGPLQTTLKMDDQAFSEAMFSWKALLYYRWRVQVLAPVLKTTLKSILSLGGKRYAADAEAFVERARMLLQRTIAESWREIGDTLRRYDAAYSTLIDSRDPDSFRRFLTQGSGLFIDLGEGIGRLEQVVSYWSHRLRGHASGMGPDEVIDALRDLLQGLSIAAGPEADYSPPEADETSSAEYALMQL
ncbi:MAG TPA: hypothetical protein VKU90_02185 [Caulobacteraceae bacterium]|nr:hypothetical protein [Caulobacteraceae bacterium]